MAAKQLLCECNHCEAVVSADIVGSYSEYDAEIGLPFENSLLKCPRCSSPMLVTQEYEQDYEGDYTIIGSPYRMYPPLERQLSWSVPRKIRACHKEASLCFKAKAYTACVVMCRKTLEGISKEYSDKQNLYSNLKKMLEDGVIDDRLYDWATALRETGNAAVHGVDVTFDKQDAVDIMDFAEAIADYLFTYREKFEDFQNRQQKKTAKKKTAKKKTVKKKTVKKKTAKK